MDKDTMSDKARTEKNGRRLFAEMTAYKLAGIISLLVLGLAGIFFAAFKNEALYSGETIAALLVGTGMLSCAAAEGYLLFTLKKKIKILSFTVFTGLFIYAAVQFFLGIANAAQ